MAFRLKLYKIHIELFSKLYRINIYFSPIKGFVLGIILKTKGFNPFKNTSSHSLMAQIVSYI